MAGLKVHNTTATYEKTLTTTAGAYSASDVVGGLITIPFADGIIRRIKVVDDDNQGAALDLYLFSGAPTAIADNGAFATAFTLADHKKWIRKLSIATGDWQTINSNKTAFVAYQSSENLGIDFASDDGVNIYAYIVCTGTPTYTSTAGLYIKFTAWLNAAG